ncbi:MAG: transposase [Coriobacteriia bacterium]|nr:transposase [Coriobacteriia bacterium]
MQRGHYKQLIFHEAEDYNTFLQLMNKYHDKYKIEIITYCLMPNHIHILIKGLNISVFVQQLTKSYSRYFNLKHKQQGSLYQGKYKRKQITNISTLLIVFKYILNNPIKANICKSRDYPWCGYADLFESNEKSWNFKLNNSNSIRGYSSPDIIIQILGGRNKVLNFINKKEPHNKCKAL